MRSTTHSTRTKRTTHRATTNAVSMDNIIPFTQRRSQPRNHKKPWGKYATLHQTYLQTNHPKFYNKLLATDKLDEWLRTIDEIANNRFEKGKMFGYSQTEIENTLFKEVIYNLR